MTRAEVEKQLDEIAAVGALEWPQVNDLREFYREKLNNFSV